MRNRLSPPEGTATPDDGPALAMSESPAPNATLRPIRRDQRLACSTRTKPARPSLHHSGTHHLYEEPTRTECSARVRSAYATVARSSVLMTIPIRGAFRRTPPLDE